MAWSINSSFQDFPLLALCDWELRWNASCKRWNNSSCRYCSNTTRWRNSNDRRSNPSEVNVFICFSFSGTSSDILLQSNRSIKINTSLGWDWLEFVGVCETSKFVDWPRKREGAYERQKEKKCEWCDLWNHHSRRERRRIHIDSVGCIQRYPVEKSNQPSLSRGVVAVLEFIALNLVLDTCVSLAPGEGEVAYVARCIKHISSLMTWSRK